ncbi:MAG TPA: tetratricopeptide repeat protein [Anaerolineales bacterium]|nr:tetratricopeptide repeat protein [Anaerolineales bacterium]
MSEYKFWDELGNIFNAIVAYQHKTIEFNKQFVNPWLRLGTVFDQNDHNADALLAAQKAIEIDHENGSNWLALGDVYFKMGSFDDAANAYSSAIELNPNLGWAYANLALVNATREKYSKAVNLYVKSLEHIADDKDRSMIWNRLGNAYRKVNDYENAFIAFQMADECDGQNTGFDDQLDEVTLDQKVMPIVAEVYVNKNARSAVQSEPTIDEAPEKLEELAENNKPGTTEEKTEKKAVATEEIESVSEIQVNEETAGNEDVEFSDKTAVADEESPGAVSLGAESQDADTVILAEADVVEYSSEDDVVINSSSEESSVQVADVETTQSKSIPDATVMQEDPEEQLSTVDALTMENKNDDLEYEVKEGEQAEFVAEPSDEAPVGEGLLDETSELLIDEPAVTEERFEFEEEIASDEPQLESTLGASIEVSADEEVSDAPVTESETVEVRPTSVDDEEGEQAEFVAEKSEEAPIEESQLDVTSEVSTDEALDDETQPISTEELVAENEQIETVVEVSTVANAVEEMRSEDAENNQDDVDTEPSLELPADEDEVPALDEAADSDESETTVSTLVMSHGVETIANPLSENEPVILVVDDLSDLFKKSGSSEEIDIEADTIEKEAKLDAQVDPIEDPTEDDAYNEKSNVTDIVDEIIALADASDEQSPAIENIQQESMAVAEDATSASTSEMEDVQPVVDKESTSDGVVEPAYEAFLKQAAAPVLGTAEKTFAHTNKLTAEPDTKNAYVWNELGNVYFNTGAFEEAVTAYSKAIELDDWFAWPYSNLALVHVQKENYAEAILLYQRSIELFSSDKDKAITWNRLGNVYRRMNDYDNAIACYQRADELDPNNATRSLRSRFSLLGSLSLEESASVTV